MKINITVDVDWIEDDGSIDEEIQHQIITGVKDSISKQCLAKVQKEASTRIDKAIEESITSVQKSIEEKAIAFADDWLENEVTVTDKWGDTQDSLTIKDLIKKTFDRLMERKVDSHGNFESGYNGKMSLLKYLTNNRVEHIVAEKLKGFNKNIDDQITKAVNAGIRENVSNKFAEMVVATAHADNQIRIGFDTK